MIDLAVKICDIINDETDVTAWNGMLPAGFTNSASAAAVRVDNDALALSGATRGVLVNIRVWGGSKLAADAYGAAESIISALTMYSDSDIGIVGEIASQQLPPEPDTGWPGYNIRLFVRVKNR